MKLSKVFIILLSTSEAVGVQLGLLYSPFRFHPAIMEKTSVCASRNSFDTKLALNGAVAFTDFLEL